MLKIQKYRHKDRNKGHFNRYSHRKHIHNISQVFYCIFDQINAVFVIRRDFLRGLFMFHSLSFMQHFILYFFMCVSVCECYVLFFSC